MTQQWWRDAPHPSQFQIASIGGQIPIIPLIQNDYFSTRLGFKSF
jgi:hypothetical protein